MNKKYAVCFCGEFDNGNGRVEALLNELENLEKLRDEFKGEVDYFFGMRKDWFPLILLREVKAGNQIALQMFNRMVKDKKSHSIYYKGWKKAWENPYRGLDDRTYYVILVSADSDNLGYVQEILSSFGFIFKFVDDLKSIWPDN